MSKKRRIILVTQLRALAQSTSKLHDALKLQIIPAVNRNQDTNIDLRPQPRVEPG